MSETRSVTKTEHVFTTGQVAKLTRVAPRTVSKWFDSKKLKGYRIPGSADRRIEQANLIEFMRAAEMPLNGLRTFLRERGYAMTGLDVDALFIGFGALARSRFSEAIKSHTLRFCENAIEGVATFFEVSPTHVVVDFSVGKSVAISIAETICSREKNVKVEIIAVCEESDVKLRELNDAGYDAVLFHPLNYTLIANHIAAGTVAAMKGGA